MTQQKMAEPFQATAPNINMHIKNIFDEGELKQKQLFSTDSAFAAYGVELFR